MAALTKAQALWVEKKNDGWKQPDDAPWMLCEGCGSDKVYFLKKGNQLRYVCSECAKWSDPVKYSKKRIVRPDQKYFRENVLQIYNNRCVLCGKPASEAHHVIPVSVGNKIGLPEYMIWSISNGIALCKECHNKWHEANFETERKLHFAKEKMKNEQQR